MFNKLLFRQHISTSLGYLQVLCRQISRVYESKIIFSKRNALYIFWNTCTVASQEPYDFIFMVEKQHAREK
jgi:hypothetical protein